MDLTIKKIVSNVVSDLQKEKLKDGSKSVWDNFVDQLSDAGAWEKDQLAIIENKILDRLNKLDTDLLKSLWEDSAIGIEKFKLADKITDKEMKEDLTNEVLDRVMDKMGGVEGDYYKEYSTNAYFATDEKEEGLTEDFDGEPDSAAIKDDFTFDDDEVFFDEDDDY
ncbi:MAG: hypothetical protein V1773_02660 [bacterium]